MGVTSRGTLFFYHSELSASELAVNIHTHSLSTLPLIICYFSFNSLTATYVGIRESIASTEGAMCQLNNVLIAAESISSSSRSAVVGVLGTFENLSER